MEAEPLIYKTAYTPPADDEREGEAGEDWFEVVAEVLTETRMELREEFRAENASLWERVTKLEGQLTTLTSLLEARKKSVRISREAELPKPPAQLRLAKR